jgi:hypothetical protein
VDGRDNKPGHDVRDRVIRRFLGAGSARTWEVRVLAPSS